MHTRSQLSLLALSLTAIACNGPGTAGSRDTATAQQPSDSPATAARVPEGRPVDTTAALAKGKEPGTIPATPTPTVTSDNSIATMRLHLQRLDTTSVQNLPGRMAEHSKMLGDLLTTMRLEIQEVTSPAKTSWIASADSAEQELARLTTAQGEALRTAFRAHSSRVRRLLDDFRVLVPGGSM